jgi:hypothetical protein
MGDRTALLQAMPEDHIDFLEQCPWVHVEDNPALGRCVFVHAGLEADGSDECEEQLQSLYCRDSRQAQPEALFGRDSVLHTPPQLARKGTTVISGHHGRVVFRTHRVILDNCCGDERNMLQAVLLPELVLVSDDGAFEKKEASFVFPTRKRIERPQASLVQSLPLERTFSPSSGPCNGNSQANSMPQGDSSPLD